jgi:rhodanese-related sulfurtransferase
MKNLLVLFISVFVLLSCEQKVYDEIEVVTPEEMQELMKMEEAQLIDIRTPKEFDKEYIKGFQNLDYTSDTFYQDLEKLDKTKPVMVTGATGYVAGWLVKKLLDENNINFIDRDIHENDAEYKSFVMETKNDYVPAFTVVNMVENEIKEVKYLTPDNDFSDINEAVDRIKEFIL